MHLLSFWGLVTCIRNTVIPSQLLAHLFPTYSVTLRTLPVAAASPCLSRHGDAWCCEVAGRHRPTRRRIPTLHVPHQPSGAKTTGFGSMGIRCQSLIHDGRTEKHYPSLLGSRLFFVTSWWNYSCWTVKKRVSRFFFVQGKTLKRPRNN